MRSSALCLGLLLIATAAAFGKQDIESEFQAAIDGLRNKYGFPGATAAFATTDRRQGIVATGFAVSESRLPMAPDSVMLAASTGKMFVAATVLSLAADGSISLDAPIVQWLGDRPWFKRLPNSELITPRHLLNHTSGISNHVHDSQFAEFFSLRAKDVSDPIKPIELVEFVLDKPALFAPGEGWEYTDTGYILLGLLIEVASGEGYYDVVAKRILRPLELDLTKPSNTINIDGLAAGYMSADNEFGLPDRTTGGDGRMVWNPAVEWTGGGLASNSLDLAKWALTLFEGNALPTPYLEDLLEKSRVVAGDGVFYGAGVSIYEGGEHGTSYGHSGWIPGYVTGVRFYPKLNAAVAFQINTDIGVVDGSTGLFDEMVSRLAGILASSRD